MASFHGLEIEQEPGGNVGVLTANGLVGLLRLGSAVTIAAHQKIGHLVWQVAIADEGLFFGPDSKQLNLALVKPWSSWMEPSHSEVI